MSAVMIDHEKARELLAAAWVKTDDQSIVPPAKVVAALNEVLAAKDVTFKCILVTGLLAKYTERQINPRALQVSSSLMGAYDARSLCHEVVVPFEKEHGDLWGLSNEPFVNKPARHPEHDKANKQLRNKKLAAPLHDILEFAHRAKWADCFAMLVHVLRVGKLRLTSRVAAQANTDASYQRVVDFVAAFLREAEGGARLVAVTGAFLTLLKDGFEVRVHPPNVSDKFGKTAGDIEVRRDGVLVSASECKHRQLTLGDVQHGLKKAREYGLREYCFVVAEGMADGQDTRIRAELDSAAKEIDALLIDIHAAAPQWAAVLNPIRRTSFGETVVHILRNSMKRADAANGAAELWNSLSVAKPNQDASGTGM